MPADIPRLIYAQGTNSVSSNRESTWVLPVGGAPLSVVVEETRGEGVEPNVGTLIKQTKIYRDKSGKMRTEVSIPGYNRDEIFIQIVDPVASEMLILHPSDQTAYRQRIERDAEFVVATPFIPNQPPVEGPFSRSEDLGHRGIDGLECEGRRVMSWLPGDVGPTTTESWFSPEIAAFVRTTVTSRAMKTGIHLSEISRSDPSPEMFNIPANYKVIELPHR